MTKSVLYFHQAKLLAVPYPRPLNAMLFPAYDDFVNVDLENLYKIPFTLSEQDEQSLRQAISAASADKQRRMIKRRMRKVIENNGYEWGEVNWSDKVVICWKKYST